MEIISPEREEWQRIWEENLEESLLVLFVVVNESRKRVR